MDVEQHLKLSEGIRSLFTANSGKPLMVDKVMQQLADKTRGVFTSPAEMKQLIQKLAQILPEWIQVSHLPAGTFIRQRGPIESFKMREAISGHFEKQRDTNSQFD